MTTIQSVSGVERALLLARVKASVFFKFLPLVFKRDSAGAGRLSPRRFFLFARRLLLFLSKLEHNKFMRIGKSVRMDLYVPSFPSRAFFAGCRKFLTFDELPPCVTVLVSVTSACRFSCEHCYQKYDTGHDIPLEKLLQVVRQLQNMGVVFFNIEGGEPFLVFDRLRAVCGALDSRADIWVNSTGDGITLERLRELKKLNLGAVMFSLHTSDPNQLGQFMRSGKAWDCLTRGVELCHQAEVPVAFNSCLEREAFYNGEFERVMERAREFKACLLQLIKPKPAGAWLNSAAPDFRQEDFARLTELVMRYNHDPAYRDYPAIAAQVLEEDRSRFGCTAGGVDRFYVNAKGDVQPCEFLNISFGNILEEEFTAIYSRMRKEFVNPGENWLCETCSPLIREGIRQQGTLKLPLPPKATSQICEKWDRGQPTDFYARLKELK